MSETTALYDPSEKRALDRLRARARRNGYRVIKSREREHLNNHGGFMLVQTDRNVCVAGGSYDLSVPEVVDWLDRLLSDAT